MTKTTTLRARSPEDLLAAVPCVLGFRPSDSVVMLTFTSASPGQTFHARVDLPGDARDHPEVVALLLEPVLRHRVERVAFVLYTDDAAAAAALAGALLDAFEAAGIDVVDALRADGSHWFGLRPGAPSEGPGRPYDDRSHPFRAQAVLDGRVTLESRDELAATLIGTDLAALEAVGTAAESGSPSARERPAVARWVRDALLRALDDASDHRLTDAEVGRLVAACRDLAVRDVAWALMSRADARRHVELWRDVVRRCPTDLLAAPAALLAFAAWLAGDGALAWCALDRCALADPDYRMAGLVAHTLEQALPPSVWTPLPESALTVLG
ncbi:MAG: DUF4192 domain-containing protein [Nocardioides sp.]